jgi:hypothetical protein
VIGTIATTLWAARLNLGDLGLPDWCVLPLGAALVLALTANFLYIGYRWRKHRVEQRERAEGRG